MIRLRYGFFSIVLALAAVVLPPVVFHSMVAQAQTQEQAQPAGQAPAGDAAPTVSAPAAEATAPAAATEPAAAPAAVQPLRDEKLAKADTQIEQARKRLENLNNQVEQSKQDDRVLADLKVQVDGMVRDLLAISVELRPRLNDIQTRLTELGEPPAEGQPAEAADVTEERNRQNAARSQINALTGQAEDLSIEGKSLADRITGIRRAIFTDQLFEHTEINTDVAAEAAESFSADVGRVHRSIVSWIVFVLKFKTVPFAITVFL